MLSLKRTPPKTPLYSLHNGKIVGGKRATAQCSNQWSVSFGLLVPKSPKSILSPLGSLGEKHQGGYVNDLR
jgi:hypothetical protein